MKKLLLLGLASSAIIFSISCGGSDPEESDDEEKDELPSVECPPEADVPTYAELTFLQTSCTGCHGTDKSGPERQEAPDDINYNTYAGAKASGLEGVGELFESPPAMPPATSNDPPVSDADRDRFNVWAQCGMPE